MFDYNASNISTEHDNTEAVNNTLKNLKMAEEETKKAAEEYLVAVVSCAYQNELLKRKKEEVIFSTIALIYVAIMIVMLIISFVIAIVFFFLSLFAYYAVRNKNFEREEMKYQGRYNFFIRHEEKFIFVKKLRWNSQKLNSKIN